MKRHPHAARHFSLLIISFFIVNTSSAQWTYVGNNISSTSAYPGNYSFALDTSGVIYVAFADLGNQYIVTVKKFVSGVWANVGIPGFITGVGNSSGLFYNPGTSIAINPVNNMPYIALADGDHDNKISVMRFNGSAWEYVGTPGFTSTSGCSGRLAFTSNGIPYLGYVDCYNSSGISVMYFNNSIWNFAGAPDFATGNYMQLTIAPDNSVAVVFQDMDHNQKISVMKLNGNFWSYAGAAGFSDDVAENTSITADGNNALYVSYTDYSHANKISVKKLIGNAWTDLGDPSFSDFDAHFTDISVNKYGVPYVSYVDHIFPVVKKFKNGNWLKVANYVATTTCNYTSILNDSLGNPLILTALQPNNNLPYVLTYHPCNDTDYHFIAAAIQDSAILHTGDSTTITVSATGGLGPYIGTGVFKVAAGYYTYYISDRNNCITSVSIDVSEPAPPCIDNYWSGNISTAWEDPENWSCGAVPGDSTIVHVEAGPDRYPVISSIVTCKKLIVEGGVTVTVAAGAKLNVIGP
ncbi:MAG: hypothetical protein ABJA78_15895 [Ferruginibacter sp.]